jgi:TrpR family trp operon transcriptional repressor
MDEFMEDILTPTELEKIVTRWQIIKQLSRGVPQREIAKKLGVSIAKITRGSRELRDKKGGFNQVLEKYYKKKQSYGFQVDQINNTEQLVAEHGTY